MSDREYDALKIEQVELICREKFRINLQINRLIVTDAPTNNNTYTTVFRSGGAIYALCEAGTPITLGQVKSIIKQMSMEADSYYPPSNDDNYFNRFARNAFLSVFPGREVVNVNDLQYYQTLAPYSPALIRIRKINGQIRRYNSHANSWQKMIDFSYFRPQVQLR
ncbi:MAG: hypothetical protein WAW80_03570 [Candidatus Saccharimonadales bacterium]